MVVVKTVVMVAITTLVLFVPTSIVQGQEEESTSVRRWATCGVPPEPPTQETYEYYSTPAGHDVDSGGRDDERDGDRGNSEGQGSAAADHNPSVGIRRMNKLQEEILERIQEMNRIMRRSQGRIVSDADKLVQFTLFTGCDDDGLNGPMMQFIQFNGDNRPSADNHGGEFWFEDLHPGGDYGGGGGTPQPEGGCHCPVNQVSCVGPCPC